MSSRAFLVVVTALATACPPSRPGEGSDVAAVLGLDAARQSDASLAGGDASPGGDSGIGDAGGEPDASEPIPPDAAAPEVVVSVDLGAAMYPALPPKVGFNAVWNVEDPGGHAAAAGAATAGAPMGSGLLETYYFSTDFDPLWSSLGPDALFYRSGGDVRTRTDANLTRLRADLQIGGMLNFLQIAGLPWENGVFTPDVCVTPPPPAPQFPPSGTSTCTTRPPQGNYYAPPIPSQVPEAAAAFVDFVRKVAAKGGPPTLWAFWQEPDHTLGEATRKKSLERYLELFKRIGQGLRQADRDAMVVGVQQNAAAGLNGSGAIDGADYAVFTGIFLATEAADAVRYPLDYATIQNYQAEKSSEVIQNSRIAYQASRFDAVSLLMNEWDFDKDKTYLEKYDTAAGAVSFLDHLAVALDAPDVSYVLVKGKLFSQDSVAAWPARFLDRMAIQRRPAVVTGPGAADVQAIATGDQGSAALLIWNRGTASRRLSLRLSSMSPALVAQKVPLVVETVAGGAPTQQQFALASTTQVDVAIPGKGILLVHAGPPPAANRLTRADFARHKQWCKRSGSAPPAGMGHYDVRSGTLVASVGSSAGLGLGGVVLKKVPSGAAYQISVDVTSAGLPASSATGHVAVRVDYLDGDASLRTVVYREASLTGPDPWAVVQAEWPAVTDLQPRTASFADATSFTLPTGADAPAGWATADGGARRLLVSLAVAGMDGPATVTARLADP